MRGGGGGFVDRGGSLVFFFSIGGGLGDAGDEGRCGLRGGESEVYLELPCSFPSWGGGYKR